MTDHARTARHPVRARAEAVRRADRNGDEDLKLFAVSFTAFFICFYTFLL